MNALKNGSDEGRKAHILEAIKSFKVFSAGAVGHLSVQNVYNGPSDSELVFEWSLTRTLV